MRCEDKATATTIWVMRHGQSTLNRAQCYQGCGAESELTAMGFDGVRSAGRRLSDESIDFIYASPLTRARQTAAVIGEELAIVGIYPELRIEAALRELELPGWEGLSYESVRRDQVDAFDRFRNSPALFHLARPSGLEVWPLLDLEERVHSLMCRIIREHPGKTILMVTHGGPARILLLTALGLTLDRFHSLQQSHAGLSLIQATSWPDDVHLKLLNETHHTGEMLPKLKEGKSGVRYLLAANDLSLLGPDSTSVGVTRLLEGLAIQRILAAGPEGVVTAMHLLRGRASVTIETFTETDLLTSFDHQLRRPQSHSLTNVLITGSSNLLSRLLMRCFPWNDQRSQYSAPLCSGLSVLHIPSTTRQPVLQAVNTHQGQSALTGARA